MKATEITQKQANNTLTAIWFIAKETVYHDEDKWWQDNEVDNGHILFNLSVLRKGFRMEGGCGTAACLAGLRTYVDPKFKPPVDMLGGIEDEQEGLVRMYGIDGELANQIFNSHDQFRNPPTQRKEVCKALCKHLRDHGYEAPTLRELGFK